MRPDSTLSKMVAKGNIVMNMAWSIPTALMNGTQSWTTTLAHTVKMLGSPMRSLQYVNDAVKSVGKYSSYLLRENIGFNKPGDAIKGIDDVEKRRIYKYMTDNGHISFGQLGELQEYAADAAIETNRIAKVSTAKKGWNMAGSAVNWFAKNGMIMFRATEHFNQRVAMEIGFRIAREQMGKNYNFEKAAEQTLQFMRSATLSGGRANRTQVQNAMGTAGNIAYGLGSYTTGWLSNLTHYTAHWLSADHLNLMPAERAKARNAALTLLGVQISAAGIMGAPFFGPAVKLISEFTNEDFEGNLYDKVSRLFNDDQAEGGGMTDVIMTGAANAMLQNAGMPVDVGSRLAVNGMLGFDARQGYTADGLLGPSGQSVAKVLAGFKSAYGGRYGEAMENIAPNGLKKMIRIWNNDSGNIETPQGRQIPGGEDTAMKVAYRLGLNPQALSKMSKFESSRRQSQALQAAENARDVADILSAIQKNPQLAQQKLMLAVQRSGGLESPRDVAMRVAKAAADKAFPIDVREEMNGRMAEHLANVARAMGISLPQASQVAKSQYINDTMAMLGQRGRPIEWRKLGQRDAMGTEYSPFAGRQKQSF
jgi:hypothetical protein